MKKFFSIGLQLDLGRYELFCLDVTFSGLIWVGVTFFGLVWLGVTFSWFRVGGYR